jgi:hypothetical protein
MTRRYALLSLILLGSLSACEKKDEMSPDAVQQHPPVDDEKRLKRPPPASSGMSSDPDNPNGAPGSGRTGTSPQRY